MNQYEKPQVEVQDFVAMERIAAPNGPTVDMSQMVNVTPGVDTDRD